MSSTSNSLSQSQTKTSPIQKKSRKNVSGSYKYIQSIHEKAKAQAFKEYKPREDSRDGLTKKQISNIQSAERSRIKKNILVNMLEDEVNKSETSSRELRDDIIQLRFSIECMKQEIEQKKQENRMKAESQNAALSSSSFDPVDLIQNHILIFNNYEDALSPILNDYSENIEEVCMEEYDEIDCQCHSIVDGCLKRTQAIEEEEDMNNTFCGQIKRRRIIGESHECFDDLTQPNEDEESIYKRLEFISSPITVVGTPASIPDDLISLSPCNPSFD